MFPGKRTTLVMVVAGAMVAGLLSGGGCAYYNMLYNAKAKYKEAEKIPAAKDGKVSRQKVEAYDIAIEKAEAMKREEAEVFEVLVEFYGMDPSVW